MEFAPRLANVETSAIRELFKLLGRPGLISFAGGFPDAELFDADGLHQASEHVFATQSKTALQYGGTEGWPKLRELVAKRLGDTGAKVQATDLVITSGSQQALDLVAKCMVSPGDTVLVEAPTFLAAIQCFKLYGAAVKGVPTDAQGVDPEALEEAIERHRPRFVYLIPTFSNPSGAVLSTERRRRILEIAARTGTLIIEDDPYGELYFRDAPPPTLLSLSDSVPGSRDWLVHCGSASKIIAPGLRVGWVVAPPALLSQVVMCKQFSDTHASTLTQAIMTEYLASGKLDAHLTRARSAYAERADAMALALRELLPDDFKFQAPAGGLFIWGTITNPEGKAKKVNVAQLAKEAVEQGVAFVPGAPFYAEDPNPLALRLSFATVNPMQIRLGVERLAAAFSALKAA